MQLCCGPSATLALWLLETRERRALLSVVWGTLIRWGISRVIEHLQSREIAAMLWEIAGSSFAGVIACSALLYLLV